MASLPLGSILPASLRSTSQQISFDPLALLAVLHNPRAAASAARLYNQPNAGVFRWPHTMMIGGALPPFKMLVDHLVSQRKSVHPALEMCKADQGRLEVQSDVPILKDVPFLPFLQGNFWLADVLTFSPSAFSTNDIVVVNLECEVKPASSLSLGKISLDLITAVTGLLLVVGAVLSVLGGDMWSTALFAVYVLHWAASVAVSFTTMIGPEENHDMRIAPDNTRRHAIYTRPEGGKVIFVGHQDTFELWARTTYTFRRNARNNILHWTWMLTGSLSCAASVVCMVNMAAWFQLAYLGTLAISSLGELIITVCVRRLQTSSRAGICNDINPSTTWSGAIVRASLTLPDEFSCHELDWIALGALPDFPIFRNLVRILPAVRRHRSAWRGEQKIVDALMEGEEERRRGLSRRVAEEILQAWREVQTGSSLIRGSEDLKA